MPSYQSEITKKDLRCGEAREKFAWHLWLGVTLGLTFPIVLACCCTLLFPGPTELVRNMLRSAAGEDAKYWAAGHWQADAVTLDAVRHWMFDPEPAATLAAEPTAPTILVSTNSGLLKPTA